MHNKVKQLSQYTVMKIMCVWPLSLERVKAVVLANCGGLQAIETIENQSRGGEGEKGIDFSRCV